MFHKVFKSETGMWQTFNLIVHGPFTNSFWYDRVFEQYMINLAVIWFITLTDVHTQQVFVIIVEILHHQTATPKIKT